MYFVYNYQSEIEIKRKTMYNLINTYQNGENKTENK